jgi:hypothetical protein
MVQCVMHLYWIDAFNVNGKQNAGACCALTVWNSAQSSVETAVQRGELVSATGH